VFVFRAEPAREKTEEKISRVGSARHEEDTEEKEAGFARILKDSTFFWRKESGAKKTSANAPGGRWH